MGASIGPRGEVIPTKSDLAAWSAEQSARKHLDEVVDSSSRKVSSLNSEVSALRQEVDILRVALAGISQKVLALTEIIKTLKSPQ